MAILDGDIIASVFEFVVPTIGLFQNRFTWQYSGSEYSDGGLLAALLGWGEDFYELASNLCPLGTYDLNMYVDKLDWDDELKKFYVERNIGTAIGEVDFTDETDALPAQSAPCLVAYTAKPKSRGRKFLPLWCEDTQNFSLIDVAAQDELAAMLAEYIATFVIETGKGLIPGITSDKWEMFLPFLGGIVNTIIFTQRRRNVGVGA
jgi:hypothetical protein